jgi:hypothetical protein
MSDLLWMSPELKESRLSRPEEASKIGDRSRKIGIARSDEPCLGHRHRLHTTGLLELPLLK